MDVPWTELYVHARHFVCYDAGELSLIGRGGDVPMLMNIRLQVFPRSLLSEPGAAALSRCDVNTSTGNAQLHFCAGVQCAPHRELTAEKLGPFPHTTQPVVPFAPISTQGHRVDAFTVITYEHPKSPFVIADFHFDPLRICVTESIAQPLRSNPVNLVPKSGVELPWRAFHLHMKRGGVAAGVGSCESISEGPDGFSKVVAFERGCAQSLHRIPSLYDRFLGLIDRAVEFLLGLPRLELVRNRLKKEQYSLKTLEKRVVQLPGNARALMDALL